MAEKPVGIVTAGMGLATALVLVLTKQCKWASEVPWDRKPSFRYEFAIIKLQQWCAYTGNALTASSGIFTALASVSVSVWFCFVSFPLVFLPFVKLKAVMLP